MEYCPWVPEVFGCTCWGVYPRVDKAHRAHPCSPHPPPASTAILIQGCRSTAEDRPGSTSDTPDVVPQTPGMELPPTRLLSCLPQTPGMELPPTRLVSCLGKSGIKKTFRVKAGGDLVREFQREPWTPEGYGSAHCCSCGRSFGKVAFLPPELTEVLLAGDSVKTRDCALLCEGCRQLAFANEELDLKPLEAKGQVRWGSRRPRRETVERLWGKEWYTPRRAVG
jgi:hypothetical protein